MSAHSPFADRFWLLAGSVPTGPFTVAQIHDELAAGRSNWQTLACPVGNSTWLPLHQIPGIGPTAPPTSESSPPPPVPVVARRAPDPTPAVGQPPAASVPTRHLPRVLTLLGAVLGLGFVAWLAYEAFRPLTAREVCQRFCDAKTIEESTRYTTANLRPALAALARSSSSEDDRDQFELTQEVEAPPGVGGRLIGFRMILHDPGARQPHRVEGFFHLTQAPDWKVEDLYFTSVDGKVAETPISLAANYQQMVPGGPPPITSTRSRSTDTALKNAKINQTIGRGLAGFLAGGGGKAVGLAILGAIGAVIGAIRAWWNRSS